MYVNMSVIFKSNNNIIEKKTNVKNPYVGMDKHIYKFTDNNLYFQTIVSPKYIGYIDNSNFIVVNLEDDFFDEQFKNEFDFLNEKNINILAMRSIVEEANQIKKRNLRKTLRKINNFNFIESNSIYTQETHKYNDANVKLTELNAILNCIDYEIKLNYVFEMENDIEVSSYSNTPITLLLCIYHKKNCISSLSIKYKDTKIIIESNTHKNHEGKKLNKLLRSVIIIIAKNMFPSAKSISSDAIDPASAYLMMKYFNAVDEKNVGIDTYKTYENISDVMKKNEFIESFVYLTDVNIDNAKSVFQTIVDKELKCEKMKIGRTKKRCKNGTRRNKHTGKCVPIVMKTSGTKMRCKNGTCKNKKNYKL